MLAIYKRELKSYFHSMTGCVFIAFLVMFTGIYFMAYNLNAGYPYFSYTLSGSLIVFLVGIPLLTMRSFSEERKTKTDQLLLTAPVSLTKVVLGKYFAMVTVLAVPNVIFCLFPLLIKLQGTAYLLVDYSSIAVFFLLGCVYIAIGLFISSLTESQLIAAAGTFGILLLSILWPGLLNFIPAAASGSLVGFLILWTLVCFILYRLTGHIPLSLGLEAAGAAVLIGTFFVKQSIFERALTGLLGKIVLTDVFDGIVSSHMLDVSGLVYYLSVAGILLFLTVQSIEKRRWS